MNNNIWSERDTMDISTLLILLFNEWAREAARFNVEESVKFRGKLALIASLSREKTRLSDTFNSGT